MVDSKGATTVSLGDSTGIVFDGVGGATGVAVFERLNHPEAASGGLVVAEGVGVSTTRGTGVGVDTTGGSVVGIRLGVMPPSGRMGSSGGTSLRDFALPDEPNQPLIIELCFLFSFV